MKNFATIFFLLIAALAVAQSEAYTVTGNAAFFDQAPYLTTEKESGASFSRYSDNESTIWKFNVKKRGGEIQRFTFWISAEKPEHGFFRLGEKNDYQVARYFDSEDMAIVHGVNFLYLVSWTAGTIMDLNTCEIFE